MSEKKACVRARGSALCPDFVAMERGVRRMLGRIYQEVSPGQWGWAPTGKSEDVARSREIAFAVAEGDLFAGDRETADWAASISKKTVEFDPSFGGAEVDQ